jgi:TolA-binding protein
MNHQVDVHPEDLLDLERSGELTAEERARLDSHTQRCTPCALVRSAARDFESERKSVPGDAALVNRISGVALEAAASLAGPTSGHRSAFVRSRPRRARRAWAIAGVVMFAATGATASFWSVRHVIVSRLFVNAPSQAPAPSPEPKEAPAAKPAGPPRVEFAPVEALPPPAQLPRTPAARVSAAPKAAAEETAPSVEQLLTAANEARRRGDTVQAAKSYRQLMQAPYAGTREASLARFNLAKMLQERGEDPAQALTLFTTFLAESPNGTLAEEARLGRAVALQRLGRPQEERQAWQDLLSSHPKSIHAERARKRLDELR